MTEASFNRIGGRTMGNIFLKGIPAAILQHDRSLVRGGGCSSGWNF